MKLNDNPKLWKILDFLGSRTLPISVDEISHKFNIPNEDVKSIIFFLSSTGYELRMEDNQNNKAIIYFPEIKPEINLKISHVQWLALQAHFPSIKDMEDKPFYHHLEDVFGSTDKNFSHYSYHDPLNVLDKTLTIKRDLLKLVQATSELSSKDKVKLIEDAVLYRKRFKTKVMDKNYELFAFQLIHLEETLCCVAENCEDHSLCSFSVDEMKKIELQNEKWLPHFTIQDVDQFVKGIRNFNNNEVRLVFKINRPLTEVEINPKFHFFRNPCLISNPKGQYVWAAYVEKGEALYKWLIKLRTSIEILDPSDIKDEFNDYCRLVKSKVA